jgi:hypothetical protein
MALAKAVHGPASVKTNGRSLVGRLANPVGQVETRVCRRDESRLIKAGGCNDFKGVVSLMTEFADDCGRNFLAAPIRGGLLLDKMRRLHNLNRMTRFRRFFLFRKIGE